MMLSSQTSAIKILILLTVYSLLATDTEAFDCNSTTGSNLQCVAILNNRLSTVCLEPASNTSSAYDLLCDGTVDCPNPGSDEGDVFNTNLQCSTQTFRCRGSTEMVSLMSLCNGTRECGDGFDEVNPLCADKCFGEYQGGCPDMFRECNNSEALFRNCGDCFDGYYEVSGGTGGACLAIPVIAQWENQTFVFSPTSTSMVFEVCWMVVIDTSVLVNTIFVASLGNRIVSLDYTVTASATGQELSVITVNFTNSTLGQRCVNFTAGINAGVIENDQNFTISLQNVTASEVVFPNGQTASVQVFERETFILTTSNGMPTSEIVVMEGNTVQICFTTTSTITRSLLEIGVEVDPSATNATNNDDFQLPVGPCVVTPLMGGSEFCFNVTVLADNEHEGSTPEQVTLSPFSVSTPDLIQPPSPSVTILIVDNDDVMAFLRVINDTIEAIEGSSVILEVVLQGQLGETITITYHLSFADGMAINGEDFTYMPSTPYVTFVSDNLTERAQQFTIYLLDDMVIEGNQTFSVSLLGTNSTIEFTIIDDSIANVFFEQSSYTVPVTATNITIRVIINETLQTSITLGVIINGIDGVRTSGPVTLMPMISYVDITLYFDNITMSGLDQEFYLDLVQIDTGSGVNINTTQSRIILEAIEIEISFEETEVMVEEGMNVTVVLTIESGIIVGNLTLNVTSETATTMDYVLPNLEVVPMPTDSMEYNFSIYITDDDIYEGEEYFTISVVEPPGFRYVNTTIIIEDNEELTVYLQEEYSIGESSMSLQISLIVMPPTGGLDIAAMLVTSLQGITATEDVDFVNDTQTINIPPISSNATAFSFNVSVIDDDLVEETEILILTVQPTEPLVISNSSNTTTTVVILDDETATVFFEQASYTVPVDNNNITLRILVNGTLAINVTLNINIIGNMEVTNSGPVILAPGSTYADITLFFDNVQRIAGTNIMLYVDAVSTGTASVTSIGTTVTLEAPEPFIMFEEATVMVEEGATLILNLTTNIPTIEGFISLTVENLTATLGADFVFPSVQAAIPTADPSVYTAVITIIDDDVFEGEETFRLSISFPAGFQNVSATVLMQDNEEFIATWTQQQYTILESVTSNIGEFQIDYPAGGLAIPLNLQLTYQDISTSGVVDQNGTTANFSINPDENMSTRIFILSSLINNDNVVELTEEFNATFQFLQAEQLSLSSMSFTTTTFVIMDDDELLISFEQMEYTVLESDSALAANVSISSSGGWEVPLEFNITLQSYSAISEEDYMQILTMTSVPPQFLNSSANFEVDIQIIDDDIPEMSERFTVSVDLITPVSVSASSNLSATVVILDDDGADQEPIVVTFEQDEFTANESDSTVVIALEISGSTPGGSQSGFDPQRDLGVVLVDGHPVLPCISEASALGNGSGSSEADYAYSSGATNLSSNRNSSGSGKDYQPGEIDDVCLLGIFNDTVNIAITNDSLVEGDEVLYLQLILNSNDSQVEIINNTITLVIYDDDILVVGFTEASYTVQEDGNNASQVCVTVTEGQLERDGRADIMVTATEVSNATESLDFVQLDDNFINITYANQDEEQCLNITEYIIDDNIVEDIEYFNLNLSTVQTTFPDDQLIIYRPVTQIFILDDDRPDVTLGDDPHFSVVLPSKKLLCFSVQGDHGFHYNLVSNKHLIMNAKFVPDSRREEVTWIGSLGLVIHGSRYGGENKTSIRLESLAHSISINHKVMLHPTDIDLISVTNGKLRISEVTHFSKGFRYPSVRFNVAGISFSVMFKREHLDLFWHSTQQQTENSHGLIGQFFHKGIVIDEVRKILIMPNKEPVPVMRRPVWSFMERETPDDQLCWTTMNPGYQGEGLIDGTHSDYIVDNILSPAFTFGPRNNEL